MKRVDIATAWRLHRFELIGLGVLIGLLSIAAVAVAGSLDATGYGDRCPRDGSAVYSSDGDRACQVMSEAFYRIASSQASPVQSVLIMLPFVLGALIGAPLIARELERGTSRLAWSLAPSRTRWFVTRVVPLAVTVFVISLVAGLALDRLLGSLEPGMDPQASFAGFGTRGVILAARAVFVLAIGVAAGAILGRSLPALILTAIIAAVGIAGGSQVHDRILASEAVIRDMSDGEFGRSGDRFLNQFFRLPDGRLASWQEIERLHPYPEDGSDWEFPSYPMVALVVPGERYPFVQLREVAALGGASLGFAGLALMVVLRRRPD